MDIIDTDIISVLLISIIDFTTKAISSYNDKSIEF